MQRVFCKNRLPETVEVEELNIVMGPNLCVHVRMRVTQTSNPGPSASPNSQIQLIPVEDIWMMRDPNSCLLLEEQRGQ